MEVLLEINSDNVTVAESLSFDVRETVRAVILDNDGKLALINVADEKFHKLPGGGIDEIETRENALRRECNEEAGVNIDNIIELGQIIEIKSSEKKVQISYCYIAIVSGKKNSPQFSDSERKRNFEVVWIGIKDAIRVIEQEHYHHENGRYIMERELRILKSASEYLR